MFSRDHGRLALISKGARRIKSRLKGVLLPFQPVLLSWVGKGEIPILTAAEIQRSELLMIDRELKGDALVCGFYCNELLVHLLHRHDPYPTLFDRYHATIMGLYETESGHVETRFASVLREFEQVMIKETGYEVSFSHEADGKTPIDGNVYYQFQQNQGFTRSVQKNPNAILGTVIIGLQSGQKSMTNERDISSGKRVMRDILSKTLGYKKINSRELFFPKSR